MTSSPNKSVGPMLAFGTLAQIAMVVMGHYNGAVKNGFAIGGMLISLIFGAMAARPATTYAAASLIGFIVGGVCALIGIAVSFFLNDVPAVVLGFGTLGSAVAGAIGGFFVRAFARRSPAVE